MRAVKAVTESGVPFHVVEMPNVREVIAGILVRAGTVDEKWPEEAGLAHATEHMLFRGNEVFPTSWEISKIIEDVGGSINAYSFREGVLYYGIISSDFADRLFEFLIPLVASPLFREEDISVEMGNIIHEIKADRDDPVEVANDVANRLAFCKHPYGREILGEIESVAGFSRQNFVDFHSKLYHRGNVSFFVVGNINSRLIGDLAERHLSELKNGGILGKSVKPAVSAVAQSAFKCREIEQAHLYMKAVIPAPCTREALALQVFSTMVDAGSSFPFHEELRNKRSLCYSASTCVATMKSNGVFSIYAGTDPSMVEAVIEASHNIIELCAGNKDLLSRAKMYLRGYFDRQYGKTSQVMQQLIEHTMFFDRFKDTQELIEETESVSINEVSDAVKKFLSPDKFVKAIVAPKVPSSSFSN